MNFSIVPANPRNASASSLGGFSSVTAVMIAESILVWASSVPTMAVNPCVS